MSARSAHPSICGHIFFTGEHTAFPKRSTIVLLIWVHFTTSCTCITMYVTKKKTLENHESWNLALMSCSKGSSFYDTVPVLMAVTWPDICRLIETLVILTFRNGACNRNAGLRFLTHILMRRTVCTMLTLYAVKLTSQFLLESLTYTSRSSQSEDLLYVTFISKETKNTFSPVFSSYPSFLL